MATENFKLGKDVRLWVATSATPTNDSGYALVENENEIELKWSVDDEEIATKSGGKVSTDGLETYEITFTVNEVFTDAGFASLYGAKNKSWNYQLREASGVWIEGKFRLTELSGKAGASGVREYTGTLKKAGNITDNGATPRALGTS
jgi:hypothetical protein